MKTWVNRRSVDPVLTGIGVSLYAAFASGGHDPLSDLSSGVRTTLFEVSSVLVGTFFAVAVTAIAIIGSLSPRSRIQFVLENAGAELNRQLVACAGAFGAVAVGFVVLLAMVDPSDSAGVWRFFAVGFVLLAILRMARLLYLLNRLLDAAANEAEGRSTSEEDAALWTRPDIDVDAYGVPKIATSPGSRVENEDLD